MPVPPVTADADAAEVTLKRIHGAYNHDGTEIQVDYFDVRYYGQVTFETPESAAFWAAENAKKAARKAATDGGTIVAKIAKVSKGRTGRNITMVHVVIEGTDGTKRLACGASLNRSTFYQTVGLDSAVNCSRCAKREARQ